jgi:hypothetical protein
MSFRRLSGLHATPIKYRFESDDYRYGASPFLR